MTPVRLNGSTRIEQRSMACVIYSVDHAHWPHARRPDITC